MRGPKKTGRECRNALATVEVRLSGIEVRLFTFTFTFMTRRNSFPEETDFYGRLVRDRVSSVGSLQVFLTKMGKLMTMNCVHDGPLEAHG